VAGTVKPRGEVRGSRNEEEIQNIFQSSKILPYPPFSKEGVRTSPFAKGGLRGIFLPWVF
jgi:hypothetical protein